MRIIHKAKKGDYPEYTEMYMKWLPDDGLILRHLKDNFEENKSLSIHCRKPLCITGISRANGA